MYRYVGNNPINSVDPLGLAIWNKLIRVYETIKKSKKLVGQVNQITNKKAAEEAGRLLETIDRSKGAKRVAETTSHETRDVLARRLSEDGKLRGPEKSPGYPEHVHPNSGPFSDVHIQTRTVIGGTVVVGAASIFTPYTEAATRNPNLDATTLRAAAAWDLASTIDPFFITDAIGWVFGIPSPETLAGDNNNEASRK